MLTGVVPFDDPSSMSVALKHLSEPPPPPRSINPKLSQQVESVILKALSKESSDRFPNGQALMDALEDALHAKPISANNRWFYRLFPAASPGRPLVNFLASPCSTACV